MAMTEVKRIANVVGNNNPNVARSEILARVRRPSKAHTARSFNRFLIMFAVLVVPSKNNLLRRSIWVSAFSSPSPSTVHVARKSSALFSSESVDSAADNASGKVTRVAIVGAGAVGS